MCTKIDLAVTPEGVLRVFPTDCHDDGKACRLLSAPFTTLGTIVDDVDLGRSHVVAVDIEVKDAAALEKAAARVGLIAVATDKWDWWGRWENDFSGANAAYLNGIDPKDYGKCEWALVQANSPLGIAEQAARAQGRRLTAAEVEAIRVKEYGQGWVRNTSKPYSVGVVKNPNGVGYRIAADEFGGGNGLLALIGEGASKLKQAYGVEAARATAVKQGHRILGEKLLADGSIRLSVAVPSKNKVTLG